MRSRGDRREEIFRDEVDRQDFLKTLAETCQMTEFALRRGWCLGSAGFREELSERDDASTSGTDEQDIEILRELVRNAKEVGPHPADSNRA